MLNDSSLRSVLSLSTWGPSFLRRWRIERHLKSVVVDDELLTKEGMGDRLTQPELREALWERGMYVFWVALQSRKLILVTQCDRRPGQVHAQSPPSLVAHHDR